jgi:hypothetical protein
MNSERGEPAARNPKVIGTLLVVFLAGAAVGALAMQMGLHDRLRRVVSAASPAPVRKPSTNDALVQRFKTDLNLSSSQTDDIAMVLDDYRHYYQNLQDQLDDVRATGKSRILQILNPEQRAKFERMMGDLEPQLEKKP